MQKKAWYIQLYKIYVFMCLNIAGNERSYVYCTFFYCMNYFLSLFFIILCSLPTLSSAKRKCEATEFVAVMVNYAFQTSIKVMQLQSGG